MGNKASSWKQLLKAINKGKVPMIKGNKVKLYKEVDKCKEGCTYDIQEPIYMIHLLAAHLEPAQFKYLVHNQQADVQSFADTKTKRMSRTPLMFAVLHDKPENVRYLIECGCNVNIADRDGNTALHFAARYGLQHCCNALLQCSRIDCSIKNGHKQTPQEVAILYNNHTEASAIKMHMDRAQQPRQFDSQDIEEEPDRTNVKLHKKLPNCQKKCPNHNQEPIFMIHYQAAHLEPDEFNALVLRQQTEVHSVVDLRTKEMSRTPLMYAVLHNKPETVRCLIECGCQLNIADREGNTALHFAAKYGLYDCCAELLQSRRIDYSMKDHYQRTPLEVACYYKQDKIVEFINQYIEENNYVQPEEFEIPQTHKYNKNKKNNYTKETLGFFRNYMFMGHKPKNVNEDRLASVLNPNPIVCRDRRSNTNNN